MKRAIASVSSVMLLAGCVSILGVDDDDYVDVQAVVCGCTDGAAMRAACSGGLAAILRRRPKLEDAILGCIEEHGNKCAALDACLVAERVCAQDGGECTPASDGTQLALRCCEGLTCGDDGTCGEDVTCAPASESCASASCCSGVRCVDGVCPTCGSVNDPCSGDTVCCDAANPLVCSGGACLECQTQSLGRCTAEFPCCSTGECPIPDGLDQGVCPEL